MNLPISDDDDDDAQSIQSYDSDHIRTYDRLSKVSSTWPPDEQQPQINNAADSGCAPLLSTFCLATSSASMTSEDVEAMEMQQCSKRDNKKRKKGPTSR